MSWNYVKLLLAQRCESTGCFGTAPLKIVSCYVNFNLKRAETSLRERLSSCCWKLATKLGRPLHCRDQAAACGQEPIYLAGCFDLVCSHWLVVTCQMYEFWVISEMDSSVWWKSQTHGSISSSYQAQLKSQIQDLGYSSEWECLPRLWNPRRVPAPALRIINK